MTYQEALAFIHGIARFGSKPGLRRVAMLLERMGNPQKQLRFVHVAGTNGKGSTCAMLSHILVEAGYRTGLYISPFVLDFRERIQYNNEMISQRELTDCAQRVKAHWDALDALGEPPTEFEFVVAVAVDYFVRKSCDVVVLEVGMGGRFDATNVIDAPLCSVITSIGIDHTQYLGETLAEIAFEKCGIIKPGGVTVCYPRQEPEALAVVMEQCARRQNELRMAGGAEIVAESIEGSDILYGELPLHIPLAGRHQVWNTLTVLETVQALRQKGFDIRDAHVSEGIAGTRFPSRLERLGREPLVLLDGAHNLSGMRALAQALDMAEGNIHAVTGMLSDKDIDGILRELCPRCASITCVQPDNPRAMPAAALAEKAGALCGEVFAARSLRDAIADAYRRCGKGDICLVCGSLYLAAEARPILLEIVEAAKL